ncbi:secreted RxLR effector protein 161-like [Ricinus communis]|uniref:secreted RxLR effector protein 161-like n=1 Tax=Ricinus communis TaxID=3988 RepID=UPI00201A5BA2|nr:secreted RxLR effector protein 161-like [Ricinus communis]
MTGCKAADTPIKPNVKLKTAAANEVMDKERYQRLVRRLIYLAHTRPDIAFAVSVVSQFIHSPGPTHFEVVFKILRYLKRTLGKGLLFKKGEYLLIEAYTDADWAGNVNDRRSTSGYCTFVGGNLVTWKSKKQSVVARSSAEAEFRYVAHGFCEVLWIKKTPRRIEDFYTSIY